MVRFVGVDVGRGPSQTVTVFYEEAMAIPDDSGPAAWAELFKSGSGRPPAKVVRRDAGTALEASCQRCFAEVAVLRQVGTDKWKLHQLRCGMCGTALFRDAQDVAAFTAVVGIGGVRRPSVTWRARMDEDRLARWVAICCHSHLSQAQCHFVITTCLDYPEQLQKLSELRGEEPVMTQPNEIAQWVLDLCQEVRKVGSA
jgi:hypothetical protein